MRSSTAIPLIAAASLIAVSCTDATLPRPEPASPEIRARLVAEGFPDSLIVDAGANFIVDGDIVIVKKDVLRRMGSIAVPGRPRFQYISNRRVAGYAYITVTVNLTGLAGLPDWANAMRDAFAEYNALSGSGVHFVEQNNSYAMVRTGSYYGENCCHVAYSHYPSGSGAPGDSVLVNTYYSYYNASQKKTVAMHELGHIIGFLHADWGVIHDVDLAGTVKIANTPDNDLDSYMQHAIGGIPWNGFPYYDRVALRTIYRGPGAVLTGSLSGGHPSLSWSPSADAVQYHVYIISKEWDDYTGMWVDGSTTFLGSTTSTSWLDSSHTFSAVGTNCDSDNPYPAYSVVITFSDGTQTWGSGYGNACFVW
jgi:hypothetical protein